MLLQFYGRRRRSSPSVWVKSSLHKFTVIINERVGKIIKFLSSSTPNYDTIWYENWRCSRRSGGKVFQYSMQFRELISNI